jgi:AcrR family transcriptional regulator
VARTADLDAHARRRAQIVEAVFRIVSRDGVEHASVRNVARDAGLSMGALRHYFATQAELLAFALGEVERRLRSRLRDVNTAADPSRALEEVLHQLLPMTPQSRVEHEIWLAFVGRAITNPALQSLNARVYDELRELIRHLVRQVVRPGQDPDLETESLYALVDGLVMHSAMRPDRWTPDRLSAVLHYHLDAMGSGRVPGPAAAYRRSAPSS